MHTQWPHVQTRPASIPVTYSEVQNYYENGTPGYRAHEWLDRHAALDSLVYLYGGAGQTLVFPRAFVGDWFGEDRFSIFGNGTVAEIRNYILSRHIDFILEFKGQPTRPIMSNSLKLLCLEEVNDFTDQNVKIFKRIENETCKSESSERHKELIRLQPKGLDFFFRKS